MKKVLLDTDILSEINKSRDPHVLVHARAYLAHHGRLTFSAVSVMEGVAGYSKRGDALKLKRFLMMANQSEVVPFDTTAADLAGRIFADLQRAGKPIGVPDTMIAAIAIHRGLPLVTGNSSDFVHVQATGYPLVLENWRSTP